jgi:outer membrane protein TolC
MTRSVCIGCLTAISLCVFSTSLMAAETLTWKRTVALAIQSSPAVAAAKAQSTVHQAAMKFSEMSPHRVTIDAEAGPRVSTEDGSVAVEARAGVDATIELGGKAAKRRAVEQAALGESKAALSEAQTVVAIDALVLWSRWITAVKRVEIRKRSLALATVFETAMRRKLAAGAATKIERNAVQLTKVRQQVALDAAHAEAGALEAELRQLLGLKNAPKVPDKITLPVLPPLPKLLETAVRKRGAVARVIAATKTALARADLAKAAGTSDITVGGFVGVEGREILAGVRFSIGLPQSTRAAREASVHRARAAVLKSKRAMTELRIRRELVRAWWLMDGQRRRVERLDRDAKPLVESSIKETIRAVQGGRVTLLELMVYTNEAFELDLTRIEAEGRVREGAVLILAAGGLL